MARERRSRRISGSRRSSKEQRQEEQEELREQEERGRWRRFLLGPSDLMILRRITS